MLSKRYGVVGNPHTGYPDAVYSRTVGLGWLRALVLDFGTYEAMLRQVPTGTNVAAVITGQTEGLNNDFWSDGWETRFADCVTRFCERFNDKVRLIEFANEWDFWDNEDRVEKAAELAMIGTNICKKYGVLGFLGSVASGNWKNQLADATAIIDRAEARVGHKLIHGFAFHPYVSYVRRDRPGDAFVVPSTSEPWERLSQKVREARAIAGNRVCALTEFGIKIGDAGGEDRQALWVHAAFEDELAGFGPHELLMATLFCWTDQNGSPGETGEHAFGLVSDRGTLRHAYRAAQYQFQRESEVDLPIAQLLATTSPAAPPAPPVEPPPPVTPPVVIPPVVGPPASVEAAHRLRWCALNERATYNHSFGFERHWRRPENAWWGAPLTADQGTHEDGRALRVFANAVVVYNEGTDTTEVLGE